MAKRVQEWFSRLLPWKKRNHAAAASTSKQDTLARTLGRFENYVVEVQKLLIWENPVYSLVSVIVVNVLFWFSTSFELSFYCFVFMALLVISAYNFVSEKCYLPHPTGVETQDWTPVHPSILTVPEISHYLSMAHCLARDYYVWLRTVRSEQPEVFCVGMCSFFLGLTVIGRAVPGLLILYVLVMGAMTLPGACNHLLPESALDRLRALPAVFRADNDSEEEYLPDQSGENLVFLQRAGEDSDKENDLEETNHFAESLTLDSEPGDSSGTGTQTSFSAGVNAMPSHDDGSVDGLDESEFDLPAPGPAETLGRAERRLDPEASDSDEDDVAEIQFQSSHFNGDSSEEEEEKLARGLSFSDERPRQEAPRQSLGGMLASTVVGAVSKNMSSLGLMGQSLLSTVVGGLSTGRAQTPGRDEEVSSGDSDDFEMISEEDYS
ncbi:reticulophagy regulator 3-like [Bacillus rossius redtenbacheri]|uniref:reticulophagy regulator 3-like n=1 Tax=Bacillus rossius redtenbacheri TaxID=93214 RepID=UPI002FDD65E1